MKYHIKIETVGQTYEGDGESVDEAIVNAGLKWPKVKGKGIITASTGERTVEHLFMLKQFRRIFLNKYARGLWAKRLELLLSEIK